MLSLQWINNLTEMYENRLRPTFEILFPALLYHKSFVLDIFKWLKR